MKGILIIILGTLLVIGSEVYANVTIEPYKTSEFNPPLRKVFPIDIKVEEAGNLTVYVESEDGDRIKTLVKNNNVKKGKVSLSWDGRDDAGMLVPSEAYFPVVEFSAKGEIVHLNPRSNSGGEIIRNIGTSFDKYRSILFSLPENARVLARGGIEGGAMMRSLLNWQVRPKGPNRIVWDSKDESGVLDIGYRPDFAVLLTAYQLSDHAIIVTSNNQPLTYSEYRKKKGVGV